MNHRYGTFILLSVFMLLSGVHAHAALERPVDQKLFCGTGYAGYEAARDYIKTRTGNDSSIDGLTPEFACGLAGFLRAAPSGITVEVGTYAVTASVKTHGVEYCQHRQCIEGTNSHPRGLAVDLFYNGENGSGGSGASAWCRQNALCTWAHQNAPQYGLMFRLMPESGCAAGYYEPWHIELQGVGGCGGTLAGGGGSWGGMLGDLLRNALVPPQPAPIASTPPEVATSSVSASSTIDVNSLFSASSFNTTPAAGSDTNAASVADRLEELAFGETIQSNSSATTSVPLVVSGYNAAGLTSSHASLASGTLSNGWYGISQQTFISGDLSWEEDNELVSQPLTGWQAILMMIKITLQKILQYLTPFGGGTDPYEEYNLL